MRETEKSGVVNEIGKWIKTLSVVILTLSMVSCITPQPPSRTLLGGPHAFFGPSAWKAYDLDPNESMKALSDNWLSFKFEAFGDDPPRYNLDKAVEYTTAMLKAAEKYKVMGCLTLSNGNDDYWSKGIGLPYFQPAVDKILAAANKDMVIIEAVSESSASRPLQVAFENYVFNEWHVKKGGAMSWNRGSRPTTLPAGYDVLDFHVFKMEDRSRIPKNLRPIVSADTTPMIFWLTGKAEYGTKYVPGTVYDMVKTCLSEKYWGVDVYPGNHDKLDIKSIEAAGKAIKEVLK